MLVSIVFVCLYNNLFSSNESVLSVLKKILFYLGLVSFSSLVAQQLKFKAITSEDGLSTNYVTSIIQDDLGFLWFGTQDGLNKYDGSIQRIFKNDPTNKNSLSNSEIICIKQVRKDLFLIGTREGLNFFNPFTEKFSKLKTSDAQLQAKVNTIVQLDNETALVGTEEGMFSLNFNSGQVKNYVFESGEKPNVKCLESVNGVIYVGTLGNGLWRLNKNKPEKVKLVKSDLFKVSDKELQSITHIGYYGNKLYLGTFGHGIFRIDVRDLEIEYHISFLKQTAASNFIKDFVIKDNKIYVASSYGFLVYNLISEEVNFYTKQETSFSLNSNLCECIYIDGEGNYWVGMSLGGINVSFFQSLKFPNSTFNSETKFNDIYSFYEYKKGWVLLGGVKTLKEVNLETGAITNHSEPFGTNTILSISKEVNCNVYWIGTWGNGIYRYDKSTKQLKNFLSKELGGTIVSLYIYGHNLYAGSIGDGLFKINLQTFEVSNFTKEHGLPNASINCIFMDSRKNVWLGTYGGGLVKMKGFDKDGKLPIEKVFVNKGKVGQISSNIVFGINEDKNGFLWVASATGLNKLLKNEQFYNFYEKDGLTNNYLYSILQDSLYNFWMSSNNGLIRFNPLQPEKDIVFKNYGIKDGLVNIEYNMGAAFVSHSGNMYFGGSKGFNVFNPSAIKDNLHAPNACIIGYKRGGDDVKTDTVITYKKHLQLTWKENYFQFEVVGIDFTDPKKNKFKYKLEGYDQDWSSPTSINVIGYSNIPGGDYTFKVKAANNDGIWNDKAYEISITIVPPFWQTKWFYILIAIIGVVGLYIYIQYRTNSIKKENKVLENKVAERTKELEEKNRDITSSIQYAKRIQEAILPSKDNIFKRLNKIFILYQPKDIVSGDFYWFAEKNNVKIFAVVDCTGHGVPGAFMSMIGHNLLHQIVIEKGILDPAEILNLLHKGIQEALRQGQNEVNTNDGMDVSIITIHDFNKEVKWAGANRPLVLIDVNGVFTKYDGNKFPVGGAQLDANRVFTTHQIPAKTPSMAYLFSDGYADQFGGEKGKKFMVKRFHDLLATIHMQSAEEQRKILCNSFEQWRQNHEQVDDVLIVGIEIRI